MDGDKPKASEIKVEFGRTGTNIFHGFLLNTDYNKDLVGTRRIDVFDQMRFGDPTVKATLLAIKLPILSANWFIQEGANDATSIKQRDFIKEVLFDQMDHSFTSFLRQALTYLDYGAYWFEKVFDRRDDGMIVWKKFAPRLPRTIEKYELEDGSPGIVQYLPTAGKAEIPGWKLLGFINEMEGENYEGVSVLRPAYFPWYAKDRLCRIDTIATERQGLGVVDVVTPVGMDQTEKNKLITAAKNLRANEQGYVLRPAGVQFGFMDMKANTVKDPKDMIIYYDRQITKAVLAQFLELGSTDSGSRALSEDHSKLFILGLQAVAKQVQEVMNKAIRELIDFNFSGVKKYPKLEVGKIGLTDPNKMAEGLLKLTQGSLLTPDYQTEVAVRQLYDLPDKEEKDYQNPMEMKFNQELELQKMMQNGGNQETKKSRNQEKQPKPLKASEELVEDVVKFRDAVTDAIKRIKSEQLAA